jgi:hypothetical protein
MSLKAARFWYQKSLGTWQRYRALPPAQKLAGDQSEQVAQDLAKCVAALADLQNTEIRSSREV